MSINVSIGFQIPTNVVEVGNEITADQLGAITSAYTPTSANPFLTHAGGTMTGGIVFNSTVEITDPSGLFLNEPVAGFPAYLTGAVFSFANGLSLNIEESHITGFNVVLPSSGTITNCGSITFADSTTQTTAPVGGLGQDAVYAISLVSLVNSTAYMSNWYGSIAYETPYLSANKVAMFKFLINNYYEFTPTWSGTSWFMSNTSDDTTYNTNGTEAFSIKWNGSDSGIPVRV